MFYVIGFYTVTGGESLVCPRVGGALLEADNSTQETEELLVQLSRLSDASLRITSSLEIDTILQATIDSARLLTDAEYGALLAFDDRGNVVD